MKLKCTKCLYEWLKKSAKNKDVPKCCPRCKRYDYSGVSQGGVKREETQKSK